MLLLVMLWAAQAVADGDDAVNAFPFFEPVSPPRSLQVMAHRGAMRQAPENSADAIERAIADTVEWVEVDVRRTRDGHHVLFHDSRLERTTDGQGLVRDHTLAEICALDAGTKFARRFAGRRVLTLSEALELARGRVNLYLDCKDVDPALLAREVTAAKMERQVVIYDDPKALQAVRAAGGAVLALMTKWRPRFGIAIWIDQVRPQAVEIDAADVTADACREFHRRGIKVQAKTLGQDDRPQVWDRVAGAGVDWIQTDLAEELLARRSLQTVKMKRHRVKIAFHRGASRYAPENTLPALAKAIKLGADLVEFDVRTTRDGQHVLLHDGQLARTTSGRGSVKDRSLDEIRALDAGAWFGRPFVGTKVPTLDEFLSVAGRRIELYVDAKDIAPEELVATLKRHQLTDRAVVYQGVAYLERLKQIAPEIRRLPPLRKANDLEMVAKRVQPYVVDAAWEILSKALIDRCHAAGILVFSDALGSHETPQQYARAIRDGIDLIQTDHPVRVLQTLELLGR
ncbi:MAG: glycerophosphodiester phosphodiesterase [Isosphaeraceae bacterium]